MRRTVILSLLCASVTFPLTAQTGVPPRAPAGPSEAPAVVQSPAPEPTRSASELAAREQQRRERIRQSKLEQLEKTEVGATAQLALAMVVVGGTLLAVLAIAGYGLVQLRHFVIRRRRRLQLLAVVSKKRAAVTSAAEEAAVPLKTLRGSFVGQLGAAQLQHFEKRRARLIESAEGELDAALLRIQSDCASDDDGTAEMAEVTELGQLSREIVEYHDTVMASLVEAEPSAQPDTDTPGAAVKPPLTETQDATPAFYPAPLNAEKYPTLKERRLAFSYELTMATEQYHDSKQLLLSTAQSALNELRITAPRSAWDDIAAQLTQSEKQLPQVHTLLGELRRLLLDDEGLASVGENLDRVRSAIDAISTASLAPSNRLRELLDAERAVSSVRSHLAARVDATHALVNRDDVGLEAGMKFQKAVAEQAIAARHLESTGTKDWIAIRRMYQSVVTLLEEAEHAAKRDISAASS